MPYIYVSVVQFQWDYQEKGQFVPTAVERNLLRRLRMANEIEGIIPYVTLKQCNTVHHKTKLEVPLCQLIDKIRTKLNGYTYVFKVQLFNRTIKNFERPNWKLDIEMVSFKHEVAISRLVHKIGSQF